MKPTVVAPTPGPVLPVGEVQLPPVPVAVVVGPLATVVAVVEVDDLPHAAVVGAMARATTPALAGIRERVMPCGLLQGRVVGYIRGAGRAPRARRCAADGRGPRVRRWSRGRAGRRGGIG